MMIRTWRGWTLPSDADAYQQLLVTEIVPGIFERRLPGLHSLEVLRRDHDDEVEFTTVMTFDNLDAVARFAGADATRSVVPPEARALLSRHDEHSAHHRSIARFTSSTKSPGSET